MELRGNDGNVEMGKVEVEMKRNLTKLYITRDEVNKHRKELEPKLKRELRLRYDALKKAIEDIKKQDEKSRHYNDLIYNIEKNIICNYEKLEDDLELIFYMIIKYMKSGKYNINQDMRDFFFLLKEGDIDRIGKGKELYRDIGKFPFNMKRTMTDWCKESQRILFQKERFDIFDLKKDILKEKEKEEGRKPKNDITRYEFYKTKEIINEIKEEEIFENSNEKEIKEEEIENLLFLDYVLGIGLTNSIHIITQGINKRSELDKLDDINKLLAELPYLQIRNELAIEIVNYVKERKNEDYDTNIRQYDFELLKSERINKIDSERVKKAEEILKIIVNSVKDIWKIKSQLVVFDWYKYEKERDLSEEKLKENSEFYIRSLLKNEKKLHLMFAQEQGYNLLELPKQLTYEEIKKQFKEFKTEKNRENGYIECERLKKENVVRLRFTDKYEEEQRKEDNDKYKKIKEREKENRKKLKQQEEKYFDDIVDEYRISEQRKSLDNLGKYAIIHMKVIENIIENFQQI